MKKLIGLILIIAFIGLVGCTVKPDPYANMSYCDRPDVDKYTDPQCLGGRDLVPPKPVE